MLAAAPEAEDGRFRCHRSSGWRADDGRTTARPFDLADDVRSGGGLTAADVVEQHLAAIELREPEIHAFNIVLADEARKRPAAIDAAVAAGDDPGPLAGVPVALKDNMCTRGIADHVLVEDPRRLAAAVRRHRRRPAARPPARS